MNNSWHIHTTFSFSKKKELSVQTVFGDGTVPKVYVNAAEAILNSSPLYSYPILSALVHLAGKSVKLLVSVDVVDRLWSLSTRNVQIQIRN